MKSKNTLRKSIKKVFRILLILLFILCFNISIINAEDTIEITIEPAMIDLFSISINNESYENITIPWEGSTQNVVVLPSDSIAVKLPDNRIGLKFSDGTVSMISSGSISFYNNDQFSNDNMVVINIDNDDVLVGLGNMIELPIQTFTSSASYRQTVDALDTYTTRIVVNELFNPDVRENIEKYSVEWGDGSEEIFDPNQIKLTHTYKKSGTYRQIFAVTDSFGNKYTIRQPYTIEYEGHLTHSYLWAQENKEPIAVSSSVGFGAILTGLIVLTEPGKYKFLALLILCFPMYTRISKEDVLDQFVRGRIYGYIESNPGVHYNKIRREIKVKNGTLAYHLRVLEKTELIKSRREGMKFRAFYPIGVKFPAQERFRMTDIQIKIMEIIKNSNGVSQKEIAQLLGKKPQTINYNIKVLKHAELIEVRKQGRWTMCFPKIVNSDNPSEP